MAQKPFSIDETIAIAQKLSALEGPLLPILHAVHKAFGHVPEAAVPAIANVLNLTRAEVHGTLTFYHDFQRTPVSGTTIKICRAEACQAMGARELVKHAQKTAGPNIRIEPIYCLGLCATAPAAMIGDQVYGRLDKQKLTDLLGATS